MLAKIGYLRDVYLWLEQPILSAMYGYFPWVFVFHIIRLEGGEVYRGSMELSDMGHTSRKPTALEGTWKGIKAVSRRTIVTKTDRNTGKKTFSRKIIKTHVAKPPSKYKKLVPLAKKIGRWTNGVAANLAQSQAYPKEFCKKMANHMRKEFEARGETFGSLKVDLQTCLPPDVCVDSYMNMLFGVELNASQTRKLSVMDLLKGKKPELQKVPEARGRRNLLPQRVP